MSRNKCCRNKVQALNMSTRNTRNLNRVIVHLFQHDKEMPLTRASVLLYVANNPDCLVRDITKRTGLNQSTVARSLAFLGDKPTRGEKDGLQWIAMTPDHEDPRRLRVNLTAKGERLMADINDLME